MKTPCIHSSRLLRPAWLSDSQQGLPAKSCRGEAEHFAKDSKCPRPVRSRGRPHGLPFLTYKEGKWVAFGSRLLGITWQLATVALEDRGNSYNRTSCRDKFRPCSPLDMEVGTYKVLAALALLP